MKWLLSIVMFCTVFFPLPSTTSDSPNIIVIINGNSIAFKDIYYNTKNNTTFVNLNSAVNALGYKISKSRNANKTVIKAEDTTLIFDKKDDSFYKNGKKIKMDQNILDIHGKLYVSMPFIKEAFKTSLYNKVKNQYVITNLKYIPVLCYHNFPRDGKADKLNTHPDIFKKQLEYLKDQGYQTITTNDLISGHLPQNPIMITADDGYLSNYTDAFPVLKELGMKMTIFVVVSSVGKTPGTVPHFSWEQAREMEASGLVDIESHTYNLHYMVNDKSAALVTKINGETDEAYRKRIAQDLSLAKSEIEHHLNKKVLALAYPYGVYNSTVESIALKVGYKALYTTETGVNFPDDPASELKRIYVFGTDTGEMIVDKIKANAY